MKLRKYIQSIQEHLIITHSELLQWFDQEKEILDFKPQEDAWNILEILEHIGLTSHYLLILINKGRDKALRNIHNVDLKKELEEFHFDLGVLDNIGVFKSFKWVRPSHMVLNGDKSIWELKDTLIFQLNQCLNILATLENGEGLLYETTMSVDNLGKLNVYEYIYFLSQHARRHIQQMEHNKSIFNRN